MCVVLAAVRRMLGVTVESHCGFNVEIEVYGKCSRNKAFWIIRLRKKLFILSYVHNLVNERGHYFE